MTRTCLFGWHHEAFTPLFEYFVTDCRSMNLKLFVPLFLGLTVASNQTPVLEKDGSSESNNLETQRTEEEIQKYKDWKVRLFYLIFILVITNYATQIFVFRKSTRITNWTRWSLKKQRWKLSLRTSKSMKPTTRNQMKLTSKAWPKTLIWLSRRWNHFVQGWRHLQGRSEVQSCVHWGSPGILPFQIQVWNLTKMNKILNFSYLNSQLHK